jgi:hypothetical protein
MFHVKLECSQFLRICAVSMLRLQHVGVGKSVILPPPNNPATETHGPRRCRDFITEGDVPQQPQHYSICVRMMPSPSRRTRHTSRRTSLPPAPSSTKHPAATRRVKRVGFYERTQPPSHCDPICRRGSELGARGGSFLSQDRRL